MGFSERCRRLSGLTTRTPASRRAPAISERDPLAIKSAAASVLGLVAIFSGAGCAREARTQSPPAIDREKTWAELRQAIPEEVRTEAQSAEHWELVHRVEKSEMIIGMSKGAVEQRLGPGIPCDFGRRGAAKGVGEWRCYPVGRLPANTIGGTAHLAIGFDGTESCVAVHAFNTQ